MRIVNRKNILPRFPLEGFVFFQYSYAKLNSMSQIFEYFLDIEILCNQYCESTLPTGTIDQFEIPHEWEVDFLGGASLAARMLYEELTPDLDPLSA